MRIGFTERGDAALHYKQVLSSINTGHFDGAVLITKSPHILADKLEDQPLGIPYIVHCTVTGWGRTAVEPGVVLPAVALEAYTELYEKLGDRCVLRVDPIFPSKQGMKKALSIIKHCRGRLRISFYDNYPHVQQRFRDAEMTLPKYSGLHAPLELRLEMLEEIQANFNGTVEVCGEPGLQCTGCISNIDMDAMGLASGSGRKAQRQSCECLAEKAELLSHKGQCAHGCLYCYWR